MNPVLLKPQSETGAQVIVQGAWSGLRSSRVSSLEAAAAHGGARLLRPPCGEADLVLVEGAGSASEINLRANDIANMGFARAAGVPVIVVGDIDRGGVIASLVGTRTVLDEDDAAMVRGFIVNRFRGDPTLFEDGMRLIADRTGWPALGLVPHFAGRGAAAGRGRPRAAAGEPRRAPILIAVPVAPRISNFDDLDPLREEPGVELALIEPGEAIPARADLVLLPGSKATIDDLHFIRAQGWDIDIKAHRRRGGRVLGLCGGYQMLGNRIDDPDGVEGEAGRSIVGLGLLDVATTLTPHKRLLAVTGTTAGGEAALSGYEMHIGETNGPEARDRPFARLMDGRTDGAMSPDGRIVGTYVHGLFANDRQRQHWLSLLGARSSDVSYDAVVDDVLDRLADHLEAHLDIERIFAISAR